jgi:hypothetical protein
MYLASIIALLFVFPLASILIEWIAGNADIAWLIGKWFVFWAVGVRLFVAGVRQAAQPAFTAATIFEIKDKDAEKIVTELGFANLAMGLLGLVSLIQPAWVVPAAIVGGLYYGLAGIKHALNSGRNAGQNIALVSDLAIFALLAAWLVAVVAGLAHGTLPAIRV